MKVVQKERRNEGDSMGLLLSGQSMNFTAG
jgi:hypothetical protein